MLKAAQGQKRPTEDKAAEPKKRGRAKGAAKAKAKAKSAAAAGSTSAAAPADDAVKAGEEIAEKAKAEEGKDDEPKGDGLEDGGIHAEGEDQGKDEGKEKDESKDDDKDNGKDEGKAKKAGRTKVSPEALGEAWKEKAGWCRDKVVGPDGDMQGL